MNNFELFVGETAEIRLLSFILYLMSAVIEQELPITIVSYAEDEELYRLHQDIINRILLDADLNSPKRRKLNIESRKLYTNDDDNALEFMAGKTKDITRVRAMWFIDGLKSAK